MKRRKMTIEEIREESTLMYVDPETAKTAGICALVDVENMGWCKDGTTMKRRKMTIEEIREESTLMYADPETAKTAGICALVDVENMGWCKDGTTRWYHFTDENGDPAVYYKY